MQFAREINRLLAAVLICFGVVALASAYWAITGPDTILARDDNPRRVLAEASIRRGALVDRRGTVLAQSTGSGSLRREYLYPATHGSLGYYSLRYGAGGAEAAFDATLRGANVERSFTDRLIGTLLHLPEQGSDVRLTLDLNIQTALADAMNGQTGAAVVLSVPGGEVLAMVSAPTYDPNTLDRDWDSLRESPGRPFFNRVVQGSYQPGAMLQTPLMAAALLYGQPINLELAGATQPVPVEDVTLTCAVRLPDMPLTLREAYAFACPRPFGELAEAVGAEALRATFETFRLDTQTPLVGVVAPPLPAEQTPTPSSPAIDEDTLMVEGVGQGKLTVSPLTMATLVAGLVNDGNAPQPYMLLATRPPGAEGWDAVAAVRPTTPVATANTARQLQDLMRYAVANGAAQNAARPNTDIGGHAAVAYSGEGPQTWFVGFATLPGRQGVSVAVVLENVADPGLAADIGGTALAAAALELQTAAENTSVPAAEGANGN